MKIKSVIKAGATAIAAVFATANPASAAVYNYTMTNNDVLSIDSTASTATFTGATINTSMASSAFATFPGGASPTFTAVLSALDGTRLINGVWTTDNPLYATTTHPQKLIMSGSNINLWAWWGDPITGGDYLTTVKSYSVNTTSGGSTGGTAVPEPGMGALLGLGVLGMVAVRRRRKGNALAA